MRNVAFIYLVVAALSSGLTANAGTRSPWPDPEERAAFQRRELERRAAVHDLLKQPETERTSLQDGYDAVYYRLSLDMRNVNLEWIIGNLEAHLVVKTDDLDTILFDFHDTMEVDSVYVDGVPAVFDHGGFDLRIYLNEPVLVGDTIVVMVFYQGHPAGQDLAFGWSEHWRTPLIWTLSEPIGAREWWPCKDRPHDKADSIDVILRVDDWMVATSNGLLAEERVETDGSKTFHWKHRYPIATYLVSVAATDYVRLEDEYVTRDGETMLIEHFVYPEHSLAAEEDLSITAEAIGVLSDRFGPYPFLEEKYGHSIFQWGGAMEHQTNTSYGSGLIRGDHHYDWILVHELGHQWWGDMVSPADWRDIWLNEGFASFSEAVWFEHVGGFEDYRAYMVNVQRVTDPSGPVYDPDELFDSNTVYNKGAWIVHMLRGVLGDSLFYAVLTEYRERASYRSSTTAEFQSIAEELAGADLDYFFGPWLYGTDRPKYAVSYLPLGGSAVPSVAVHLEQTQRNGVYFNMPVDLGIQLDGGGVYRTRVWNDPDHQDYELDLPVGAAGIEVDPDDWILKKVELDPYRMHITTTDLPAGVQDSLYEVTLRSRGGDPPYEWFAGDSLPYGMELDSETGRLRGFAPRAGVYDFSVEVADAADRHDTQRYEWTVDAVADTAIVVAPDLVNFKVGPVPAHRYAWFMVEVPVRVDATLDVYDLNGRRVRGLWNGPVPSRAISWDGRNDHGEKVASGIYIAKLRSGGRTYTHRIAWLWKM